MKSLLPISLMIGLSAFGSQKVIYGDDNRVDVFESKDQLFVELSESTAAMISKKNLSKKWFGAMTKIKGRSLEDRGICSTERFAKQMSAANCSGFLVGEDLLVTAGHCITNNTDCDEYNWVFGFKVDSSDQFDVSVRTNDVYSCKKIIDRNLGRVDGSADDWALIRLDRKVIDRKVLEVREQGQPEVGTNLVVIGHPTGIPTKIADGATVTKLDKNFFYADLDTYGGNSGSAVFNSETGVVEGILVRGKTDYNYDYDQGCRVSNVVDQGVEQSEGVSNISRVSKLIEEHK